MSFEFEFLLNFWVCYFLVDRRWLIRDYDIRVFRYMFFYNRNYWKGFGGEY